MFCLPIWQAYKYNKEAHVQYMLCTRYFMKPHDDFSSAKMRNYKIHAYSYEKHKQEMWYCSFCHSWPLQLFKA